MGREGDTDEAGWESLWRRRSVPENEVPVSVAFDATLARTDDVAVFVSGLHVYSSGVLFTLQLRSRTGQLVGGDLHSALHDRGRTALLLGVELADGQRCTHDRRGAPDPRGPVLVAQGGSGSSRSSDLGLFLSPLPPAGVTKLVCAWPELGIDDQVTVLPTDEILAAAARVTELWPWEPEQPRAERVASLPDVPDGSWFSPGRSDSAARREEQQDTP